MASYLPAVLSILAKILNPLALCNNPMRDIHLHLQMGKRRLWEYRNWPKVMANLVQDSSKILTWAYTAKHPHYLEIPRVSVSLLVSFGVLERNRTGRREKYAFTSLKYISIKISVYLACTQTNTTRFISRNGPVQLWELASAVQSGRTTGWHTWAGTWASCHLQATFLFPQGIHFAWVF